MLPRSIKTFYVYESSNEDDLFIKVSVKSTHLLAVIRRGVFTGFVRHHIKVTDGVVLKDADAQDSTLSDQDALAIVESIDETVAHEFFMKRNNGALFQSFEGCLKWFYMNYLLVTESCNLLRLRNKTQCIHLKLNSMCTNLDVASFVEVEDQDTINAYQKVDITYPDDVDIAEKVKPLIKDVVAFYKKQQLLQWARNEKHLQRRKEKRVAENPSKEVEDSSDFDTDDDEDYDYDDDDDEEEIEPDDLFDTSELSTDKKMIIVEMCNQLDLGEATENFNELMKYYVRLKHID